MKKLFALALLAAILLPAFADDALVLPARTLRLSIVPTYTTRTKNYDNDGKLIDITNHDSISTGNLGFALEYGLTNWISADVHWTPGLTVYSKVVSDVYKYENYNGIFDLFAGVKIQIVGEKAPVKNASFRLAMTPGLKIPMPDPDWQEQYKNNLNHEDYTAQSLDLHAWGVGGRLSFDYVLNKMFFFNLYSEYLYFFERKNANRMPAPNATTYDFAYGYSLTFEAEPHFEFMLGKDLRLGLSLPANYTMFPDYKVDGKTQDDSAKCFLKLTPTASLFLMKSFIPLEFKAGYSMPLWGIQAEAFSSIILQIKAYIKF
jgi:hypothetical protein